MVNMMDVLWSAGLWQGKLFRFEITCSRIHIWCQSSEFILEQMEPSSLYSLQCHHHCHSSQCCYHQSSLPPQSLSPPHLSYPPAGQCQFMAYLMFWGYWNDLVGLWPLTLTLHPLTCARGPSTPSGGWQCKWMKFALQCRELLLFYGNLLDIVSAASPLVECRMLFEEDCLLGLRRLIVSPVWF